MDAQTLFPDKIGELPGALLPMRERLLANLVMIAQIPAPTGDETRRVRFLMDRFAEAGLTDATCDEVGNAVGVLRGKTSRRAILLASHLDTVISATQDHTVTVKADRIFAPAVGDNALGAAIVSLMPAVLEHLGIQLESDLILLGSTRAVGRGNQAGIRFFLDHAPQKIHSGICVEGMQLGRLDFFSIGTARADITCSVRQTADSSRSYGSESALVVLNHIIARILAIATPTRPYTVIRMGKMHAGDSYDVEPDQAELGLEIISHSDAMIDQIRGQINDIVVEMTARHAVDAELDVFFSTKAGGIPFAHPLVKSVLEVMSRLGIEPDQGPNPSELSELVSRNIPAVTLGITRGRRASRRQPDHVLIEPILTGVAQLIGVIMAIEQGVCDEP